MNENQIHPEIRHLVGDALSEAWKARRTVETAWNDLAPGPVLERMTEMNGMEIPPEIRGLVQGAQNEWEKQRWTAQAAQQASAPTEMVVIEREWEPEGEPFWTGLADTIHEVLDARCTPQGKPGEEAGATAGVHETGIMVHSPDYSTVGWGEKTFTFTTRQAACICVMWEQFQRGTAFLKWSYILVNAADKYREKTGLEGKELNDLEKCSRLRDVFKNHEAWGTMIVKRGRDLFGLVAPPL